MLLLEEINKRKKCFNATSDILACEDILNKVTRIEHFLLHHYRNRNTIMFIKAIYYFFAHFTVEDFRHFI